MLRVSLSLLALFSLGILCDRARAADEKPAKQESIDLADGKIVLAAPVGWVRKDPAVRIIEHEFAVPKAEGDDQDGRVTVMGAGGGVKANVDRWKGQFTGLGKTSEKELKVKELTIHVVDLSGTYKDQRGPMAPAVSRENHRMLGAIIVSDKLGSYFIKFTGPEKTVATGAEAFQKMLESLERK